MKLWLVGYAKEYAVPGDVLVIEPHFTSWYLDANKLLTTTPEGTLTVTEPCWVLYIKLKDRPLKFVLLYVRRLDYRSKPISRRKGNNVYNNTDLSKKLRLLYPGIVPGRPSLVYREEILLNGYRVDWIVDRDVYQKLPQIPMFALRKVTLSVTPRKSDV